MHAICRCTAFLRLCETGRSLTVLASAHSGRQRPGHSKPTAAAATMEPLPPPPSALLAGINTITITCSPRGQPASPPPSSSTGLPGCLPRLGGGRGAASRPLNRYWKGGGKGCPQAKLLWPWQPPPGPWYSRVLTWTSQAYLHTASLEFTAALMLRHNEVAAAMQAGQECGKVALLAAARQDGEGGTHEAGCQAKLECGHVQHQRTASECDHAFCTPLGWPVTPHV